MDIAKYEVRDIYGLLDENNRQMVDRLREVHPVEFRVWNSSHYLSLVKVKDVPCPTIVVLFYTPISQEKIAHELLHMFCAVTLGTNECMLAQDEDDEICKKIFTDAFCERLLNNSEHIIIYPEYLDLGYEPSLFFEPYKDPQEVVNQFKQYGIKIGGKYSLTMIINYLSLCIHLESFPFDNSCRKYLNQMIKFEYPLYYIVSGFFKKIKGIEITPDNYEFMQEQYKAFRDSVSSWCKRNKSMIVDDVQDKQE